MSILRTLQQRRLSTDRSDYVNSGRVKYVFFDLPLDFHKQAFKAAEAAHCAGEQGQYAKRIGLSETTFQQCLESGRFGADMRKLVGAKPYTEFKAVVDSVLTRRQPPTNQPLRPDAVSHFPDPIFRNAPIARPASARRFRY